MRFSSKIRVWYVRLGLPVVCAAFPLMGAEEANATRPPSVAEILAFFSDAKDGVTSEWTDLASDSQAWSKHTKDGYVPVRNEGRNKDGADQYTKTFKKKPAGMMVFCRTAEPEVAHRQNDTNLIKKGYVLVRLQAFTDAQGGAHFQALWVKVAEPPTEAAG